MHEQRGTGAPALPDTDDSRTVCGWILLRKPLQPTGPICLSWLAERAERPHPQGVVRILREPFASEPDVRSEWLRASWAANRFEHARVAKILEEGVDETGAPVVVRRWIAGEDLARVVAHGRIDSGLALRIAEQLLDALEMAHAHGIAHGAIAPSNIIVTPRGSVRLVDFATTPGLRARQNATMSAIASARVATFAAPERRLGWATEQADIWSVGACLHFALSAALPTDGALAPLGVTRPDLDAGLAAVVDRALARDPADRYESAYAMLGDIRRVMAGRKPKLGGAHAPVPSQGMPEVPAPNAHSAGMNSVAARTNEHGCESGPVRSLQDPIAATPTTSSANEQWRGNVVLVVAIAVLVGVASFVMFREKLADVAETHQVR